uniref:Uncharacterized protein n=1 Tax=Anguilla anguilla TaxID=7936 RepID=A0A0E9WRT9_ANGAN
MKSTEIQAHIQQGHQTANFSIHLQVRLVVQCHPFGGEKISGTRSLSFSKVFSEHFLGHLT